MDDKAGGNLIENVAASLVREYLSRKGLKSVLHALDNELPRHRDSISNRGALIQVLHLEKAVKRNKVSHHPFRTLLEIITKELVGKYPQCKAVTSRLENSLSNNCGSCHTAINDGTVNTLNTDTGVIKVINVSSISQSGEKIEAANNAFSEVLPSSLSSASQKQFVHDNVNKPLYSDASKTFQTTKDNHLLDDKGLSGSMAKTKQLEENHSHLNHKLGFGPVSSSLQNPRERRRLRSSHSGSIIHSDHLVNNSSIHLANEKEQNSEETCTWNIEEKESKSVCLPIEADAYDSKVLSDEKQISVLDKIYKERSIKMDIKRNSQELIRDTINDIELYDISDSDDPDICNMSIKPYITSQVIPDYSCIRPITMEEACELKKLLFGSHRECFGQEWTGQGFTFCNIPSLTYGIIQKKAGPCGVLAAVQAHILCELLFGVMDNCLQSGCLRPKEKDRVEALAKALSTILWQAGEKTQAVLAVNSERQVLEVDGLRTFKSDGILDCLILRVFNSYDVLLDFLRDIIPKLEADGSCVTFLYSAILSRGIERIRTDMDHPNSHLIGQYGYCSQEIVNLLLVGHAVPNVFDGDVELNTGGKDKTILHGIPVPSKIGLLSLYEYQNTCEVGNYYKSPHFPIWIVLGESHFSVLFATSKDVMEKMKTKKPFSLFYFDGLASQEKEICLTVDPGAGKQLSPGSDDDYLSPVERCIRTRWKGSSINWNGTTPPF